MPGFANSLPAGAGELIPCPRQLVPPWLPLRVSGNGIGKAVRSAPRGSPGPRLGPQAPNELVEGRAASFQHWRLRLPAPLCKQVSRPGSRRKALEGASQRRTLKPAGCTSPPFPGHLAIRQLLAVDRSGEARGREQSGFGSSAAASRFLPRPPGAEISRRRGSKGTWRLAIRGPRNDVRGRHIFSGFFRG